MKILAIETATQMMGAAIMVDDRLVASYELLAENPHGVELPGAVARVLTAAHLTLAQIDAIVVDRGPGSFTGLRIGLAFAKALAYPRKTPLLGIASLDVLAEGVGMAGQPVVPLLDAKQRNLYGAVYRPDGVALKRQSDYLLGPVAEVLAYIQEPSILLGDACGRFRDQIVAASPKSIIAPPECWLPKAATLARLGAARVAAEGKGDDPATLVPLYLYPLDCSVRSPQRTTSTIPPLAPPQEQGAHARAT